MSAPTDPATVVDFRSFAEAIEHDFAEARELIATAHCEMGLLRAVTSFEWFIKRAFFQPYLEVVAVGLTDELAELLMGTLRRRNGWKNEIPRLLHAFWSIDVTRMPAWIAFIAAWDLRNKIAHERGHCEANEAEDAVHACEVVVQSLLVGRIDASASPRPVL